MDLTSAVVDFKQAQVTSQVQYAVARKILDQQQLQGNAAIKLIQAAGETGSKGADSLAVAATGLGGAVDAYA
jgi:hypothetical protein